MLDNIDVIVYSAKAMTGRKGSDLLNESKKTNNILQENGITVLDPVVAEGVKNTNKKLANKAMELYNYWRRDKEMIREAHVVLDITGAAKSEGVAHEIGYARYCLFKPVVRIYPEDELHRVSVAQFEDDVIVSSVEDAANVIVKLWGTKRKRIAWRIKLLLRCLPRWIYYQMREFK